MIQPKPCPFCGAPGIYHQHGYGDEYCSVGCSNDDCLVHPQVHATPKSKPWDESKTTFYVLWDEAEEEAAIKWNQRQDSTTEEPK